jgi:PTH1 family peptidyl-tRNA hydrolase
MHLIVGLGNPGDQYRSNRHNIGFMAADAIAARHGLSPWRQKFRGLLAEGSIGGHRVLLLKPQTFMNSSGDSVGAAVKFHKLDPADVIVIYDELDLVPGKVRVKVGGGNGGHNGLRSIDPQIGTGYKRVRLGIGHPGSKDAVTRHVLNDFAKADAAWLTPLLDAVAGNVGLLLDGDDNGFMNKVALAVQGDGAERPERPLTADATRPKAQSHIRAARPKPPQVKVPETGPMAAMLQKLLGNKNGDDTN